MRVGTSTSIGEEGTSPADRHSRKKSIPPSLLGWGVVMNAPATIAQLALAREQSQRCEYKAALRNFEGVLTQLDECAPTLQVLNHQLQDYVLVQYTFLLNVRII